MKDFHIVKADGTQEDYDREKLRANIRRAGIPGDLQEVVLRKVEDKLYENITTQEIYDVVNDYLEGSDNRFFRSRFSLKQSIMQLGPTGYPFEDYIARILNFQGYDCEVRVIMNGKCVKHEIDVIANNDKEKIMVEAKFHNKTGIKSDVQVAMYTKARFDDIKVKDHINKAMLVTNTKVTTDAIAYATCENLEVLGWKYPENKGLRDIIEEQRLYPLTIMSSLESSQKAQLLANHVVLVQDICKDNNVLKMIGISSETRKQVLDEVAFFCH